MAATDTSSATRDHRPRIIVGVDGSPGANRALSWAFSEAEQRGADLEVVIAWDFPYKWAEGFNTERGEDTDYFAASPATRPVPRSTPSSRASPAPPG